MAHSWLGHVLQSQGKLPESQTEFQQALDISRRLAEQAPTNAGWQRELAVMCSRIANLESKAGRHAAALPLYEEASRIFGELATKAPAFAQWVKDRDNVNKQLALCRSAVAAAQLQGSASEDSATSLTQ